MDEISEAYIVFFLMAMISIAWYFLFPVTFMKLHKSMIIKSLAKQNAKLVSYKLVLFPFLKYSIWNSSCVYEITVQPVDDRPYTDVCIVSLINGVFWTDGNKRYIYK